MKVRNVMKRPVLSGEHQASIADAAKLMGEQDVGALPVVENGKSVGIVTDRDVPICAVARGVAARSPVQSIMTDYVVTCRPDDELDDLLELMANHQVGRVPVTGGDGGFVDMVSIGDVARLDWDKGEVAETLAAICHPHGPHCQTLTAA